ncbi:MAG TPA: hypothetical protein VHE83_03120 [Mycobacteriales bacterium]|nr:hypothetical protein [Mycobacteriales bacterium]
MTTISTPISDAPTGPIDAGAVRASSRFATLASAISTVRRRGRGDERIAKVMRVVGALLLPLGIAAIITGWYGASHTGKIYEQNSYLISGGIFGLALVFAGGFLYFSYWLTRQLEVARATQQQNLEANRRLEQRLDQLAAATQTLAAAVAAQQPTAPRSSTSRPR